MQPCAPVTNVCLTNKSLRSSVHPSRYQTLILFSQAFAIARRAESEVRTDRNNGGTDRTGAARAFVDAVIACDRLARTVVRGSVERVVEEVIERGAPIPQHAQHLRVLVRDASLGPSRYRECYAQEGGAGTKRASRRGDKSERAHADRLMSYPHRHNLSTCSSPIRVVACSSRISSLHAIMPAAHGARG